PKGVDLRSSGVGLRGFESHLLPFQYFIFILLHGPARAPLHKKTNIYFHVPNDIRTILYKFKVVFILNGK
ncbi:MAG: hypothetical protein BZ135_03090, partial [Methanosphaera sp. rholeuAM6]